MSENPYSAAKAEHEAFMATVPLLEDVIDAFMADEIESFDLEVFVGAAVFEVAMSLPVAIARRAYERRQQQVRFTDAPGHITTYRRPRPQHARNAQAILKAGWTSEYTKAVLAADPDSGWRQAVERKLLNE